MSEQQRVLMLKVFNSLKGLMQCASKKTTKKCDGTVRRGEVPSH